MDRARDGVAVGGGEGWRGGVSRGGGWLAAGGAGKQKRQLRLSLSLFLSAARRGAWVGRKPRHAARFLLFDPNAGGSPPGRCANERRGGAANNTGREWCGGRAGGGGGGCVVWNERGCARWEVEQNACESAGAGVEGSAGWLEGLGRSQRRCCSQLLPGLLALARPLLPLLLLLLLRNR